ncbi:MAG TPA: BTAD domain-containing putative transcriptional regulator, partial [Jatrophihabitantaceae bacterium]
MSGSPFHLPRPRLTDTLGRASVATIVGGGGYGKSALAAELSATLGIPTITAVLAEDGSSAAVLMARLRAAVTALGLSDVTAQLGSAAADDPAAQLVALSAALNGQSVLFVIDEVHHADASAAALLADAASTLPLEHRLLLIGRGLPAALAGPDALGDRAVALGITDLALTAEELRALAGTGYRQPLSVHQAFDLLDATGGWLAAVLLLFGGSLVGEQNVDAAGIEVRSQGALDALIDQLLDRLTAAQRQGAIQMAHLPLLDDAIVRAVFDDGELLDAVRAAGLPMTGAARATMQFAGPVREALRRRGAIAVQSIERCVQHLVERELFSVCVRFLLEYDRPASAARVLAELTSRQAEELDLAEFAQLVGDIADAAAREHPRLLLNLARACEVGAVTRVRTAALARAQTLIEAASQPALARELAAELARDLVWNERIDEGEEMAKSALDGTRLDEELVRARLLDVLGRAAAVRRDDIHLARAQERLEIAADIYRSHEEWTWLAQVLGMLALWVQAARGQFDQALRSLDDSLSAAPHQRRMRGLILTFKAELLDQLGRADESAECLIEAEDIAAAVGDPRLLAYTAWDRARQASHLDEREQVLAHLATVEQYSSDWFDQSGCCFLSDAADFCDRVGLIAEAGVYLSRALDHPLRDEPPLARAQLAVAARHGDPEVAERHAQRILAASWFEPRDRWRCELFRAYAAARRGDIDVAARHATAAFEHAAKLGYPRLPFADERTVTDDLLAILGEDERLVAIAATEETSPVVIKVLGGFRVTSAGRPIEVAAGQGRQLLKMVATAGGAMPADQAIELLWPDVEPGIGANRLRTVLNRLRESAREIVMRDDAVLRLAPRVHTDAERFEHQAGRAQSLAAQRSPEALPVARTALSIYRGDLLPDDQYESWSAVPRERLRGHAVALLDICCAAAAQVGDLDEAVRCLQRATELEPYQEERYLAAARYLIRQGRRGAAQAQLRRARDVISDLGVQAPPGLVRLERQIGVVTGSP